MNLLLQHSLFYVFPFGLSLVAALLITSRVRAVATAYEVLDLPNTSKKIHTRPIPLWGGLAIAIVLIGVSSLLWTMHWEQMVYDITAAQFVGLIAASIVIVVGGMIDDVKNISPGKQIIFPLLAVGIVLSAGILVRYITNPFGGVLEFEQWRITFGDFSLSPVAVTVSFVWILGMMYTTKLLDGLDGLVSGLGAIGAVIIFVVSLYWNQPFSSVSVLSLVLAGACLGFLVYNFNPASIFLGESGSLLIGFWLGVLSIISGSKIATALLIMGIPILDVVWVIFRRVVLEKTSPFHTADQKHLHHRLLQRGLSQRQVVCVYYTVTVLFGLIALWQQTIGKIIALGVVVGVMVLLGWLVLPRSQKSV